MNLGMGEIIVLLVLALLLFGPKRLPEVGRAAGKAIREFKSALNSVEVETPAENTLAVEDEKATKDTKETKSV